MIEFGIYALLACFGHDRFHIVTPANKIDNKYKQHD